MTERQHRARRHAVRGTVSVALVLALAGLMFTANARLARTEEGRHPQNLEGLAERESARVEELASRVDGLRAEVERLTESATRTVDTGDPAEEALVAVRRRPLGGDRAGTHRGPHRRAGRRPPA